MVVPVKTHTVYPKVSRIQIFLSGTMGYPDTAMAPNVDIASARKRQSTNPS